MARKTPRAGAWIWLVVLAFLALIVLAAVRNLGPRVPGAPATGSMSQGAPGMNAQGQAQGQSSMPGMNMGGANTSGAASGSSASGASGQRVSGQGQDASGQGGGAGGMNMNGAAPGAGGTSLLDGVLIAWFALTAVSVAYVAWDAFTRNPEMKVMKWGWLLVTLYTGPIGAALYVLSCREPAPGEHEAFVRPLWKQSLGSTIHCLAGDATGIIVAAAVTLTLGLPMWVDVISEYVFGFAFGLSIFQALFMRSMLGGTYLTALRRSFLPEWLSMNAVMAGMVPVMVILMSRDMRAMEPTSLRFWGVMSLATLVGFVIAYPVNVWLVSTGLKHGMGTVRALGRGGHSLAAERRLIEATSGEEPAPNAATAMPRMEGM